MSPVTTGLMGIRSRSVALLSALVMALVVSGCSSHGQNHAAPVSARVQPPSKKIQVHQVEAGETLYSIAWRYDLDFRQLARANGIRAPFVINRGQLISLDTSKIRETAVAAAPAPMKKAVAKPTSSGASVAIQKPLKPTSAPRAAEKPTTTPEPVYATDWQWRWPVKGNIVESFNPDNLRKGIKIKAVSNSAVHSAAPGVVVYAGEGLRGYGKLVIIKHSETLLSAYAQNAQLLVKEGQSIKQMEIISRLGSNGTLHFEIRKDGYPVNPAAYLK